MIRKLGLGLLALLLAGCSGSRGKTSALPTGGDCDISEPKFSVKKDFDKTATRSTAAKLEAAAKKDVSRLKSGADGTVGGEYHETVNEAIHSEFVLSPRVQEIAYEMWLVECAVRRGSISSREGERQLLAIIEQFASAKGLARPRYDLIQLMGTGGFGNGSGRANLGGGLVRALAAVSQRIDVGATVSGTWYPNGRLLTPSLVVRYRADRGRDVRLYGLVHSGYSLGEVYSVDLAPTPNPDGWRFGVGGGVVLRYGLTLELGLAEQESAFHRADGRVTNGYFGEITLSGGISLW